MSMYEKLNSKERLVADFLFVLDKITEQEAYQLQNEDIEYRIYSPSFDKNAPSSIVQGKILRKLENLKVIQLRRPPKGKNRTLEIMDRGENRFLVIEYIKKLPKFLKIYDKYKDDYRKIQEKYLETPISSFLAFEGKIFRLKLLDGGSAVVDFHLRKGEGSNTSHLMQAMVSELTNDGRILDGRAEVVCDRDRIFDYMKRELKFSLAVDPHTWLKTTRGNLVKKIPEAYKRLIKIGNYDRSSKGYPFSVKLPI